MSFAKPKWNQEHVILPSKLLERIYEGYSFSVRIRRKIKLTTIDEMVVRKIKSVKNVPNEKIWDKDVYLDEYLPEASYLLDQGFTIILNVGLNEIEVLAEKIL